MPEVAAIGRIEICGGIATGKTTLAHLLADGNGCGLALENFRANPFWARFYEEPERFTLEKNICFLAQHTGEIKSHADDRLLVCDYAVFQDLAYATLSTASGHLEIMRGLYDHLMAALPPPALIIHLSCDAQVQLERIHARGREEEKDITLDYLYSLNDAIESILRQPALVDATILNVDSDRLDFVRDDKVRSSIARQAVSMVEMRNKGKR